MIEPAARSSGPSAFVMGFFVFWMALAVAGFLLFYVNKNVAFKRRYFSWYLALAGVLFVCLVLGTGGAAGLWLVVPAIALITFMNIHLTRFCDACGRTIIGQMFSRPKFCPKCGAALNGAPTQ